MGSSVLPGTAMLDLAWHAGRHCGHPVVGELVLQTPLRLPERGAVRLQLTVTPSERDGAATIAIHSRPEHGGGDRGGEDQARQWVCHASGTLLAEPDRPRHAFAEGLERLGQWPGAQAQPLDLEELEDRLVSSGLEYGPSFQGLRAAWRDGEDLLAEAVLDEREAAQAGSFGVHPALLDAVLHTLAVLEPPGGEGDGVPRLPFCWNDAMLIGASPQRLRVRFSPSSGDSFSLAIADGDGEPVGHVGSLTVRAAATAPEAPGTGAADGAFKVSWVDGTHAVGEAAGGQPQLFCIGERVGAALRGAGVSCEVHPDLEAFAEAYASSTATGCLLLDASGGVEELEASLQGTLGVMQAFLADDRLDTATLAVVTEGAVATSLEEKLRISSARLPAASCAPLSWRALDVSCWSTSMAATRR